MLAHRVEQRAMMVEVQRARGLRALARSVPHNITMPCLDEDDSVILFRHAEKAENGSHGEGQVNAQEVIVASFPTRLIDPSALIAIYCILTTTQIDDTSYRHVQARSPNDIPLVFVPPTDITPNALFFSYYAHWDRSGASVADRKTSGLCATFGANNIYGICVHVVMIKEGGARGMVAEVITIEEVNNSAAEHREKVDNSDKVGAISRTESTR